MVRDSTDDKSTLVQVMAWCRQATSHYLSQCWPRYKPPYGVTRPHWVKLFLMNISKRCSRTCMTNYGYANVLFMSWYIRASCYSWLVTSGPHCYTWAYHNFIEKTVIKVPCLARNCHTGASNYPDDMGVFPGIVYQTLCMYIIALKGNTIRQLLLGWCLLKLLSSICNNFLNRPDCIHIWQVSPKLSCGDTKGKYHIPRVNNIPWFWKTEK